MNKMETFQEFLTRQTTHIPLFGFVLNLLLAVILCAILGWIYTRYGRALSNRRAFAHNFVIIGATTMVIISVVKSSLALSLGLVGALSIVRFRAAIKEPEELAYLFLVIAIGLGLGADQRVITLVAFALITGIICFKGILTKSDEAQNLHLTVSNNQANPVALQNVTDILKKHCEDIQLRRFDENDSNFEASFLIACDDFEKLKQCKDELRNLSKTMKVTYLNQSGMM